MANQRMVFDTMHQEELAALGATPETKLAALCISGGGIRSATFALGVIQGLAKRGYLDRFHYMSTVSGGGYIGGWLTAWIHRFGGVTSVADALAHPKPEDPVHWLRNYSNYLSPQLGLFSADTWTLASIYLRNLLLNWLIIIPFLAALMLIPRIVVMAISVNSGKMRWIAIGYVVLGFMCAAFGMSHIPKYMRERGLKAAPEAEVVKRHVLAVVLSAIFLSTGWFYLAPLYQLDSARGLLWLAAFGGALHLAGWGWGFARIGWWPPRVLISWITVIVSGAFAGTMAWIAGAKWLWPDPNRVVVFAALGMPLLIALLLLAGVIFVGVASSSLLRHGDGGEGFLTDSDREWWARSGAWMMIAAFGWLALSAISLYGPWLILQGRSALWTACGGSISGILAAWIGWNSRTNGKGPEEPSKSGSVLSKLGEKLLAPAFVLILLAFLSLCFTVIGLGSWPEPDEHFFQLQRFSLFLGARQVFYGWSMAAVWSRLADLWQMVAFALLTGLGFAACSLFSINRFSIHYLYRNRLIRAYLGASNPDRKSGVSMFTGFAESDNIFMAKLKGQRPLHVISLALNITKGHRLAWQNRKAAAFSVSPYGVGSFLRDPDSGVELGYRDPEHYTDGGLSLGTAVAVSGAAASPNMGFHTSTVLSFLLTFFNLRLGAWFPNPSSPKEELFAKNGPSTPNVVLKELLGMTHERSDWIYLSDGGHFENLALLEMLKRRCRLILLTDAGADPQYTFEDLGNAVHKARVDMDVCIEFAGERQLGDACRAQHWSLLRVRYPDNTAGLILYLKPAISMELSADVLSYSAANKEFPQQTTGDQFFDEGQFEAYRRLGEQTMEMIGRGCPDGDLDALFRWADEKFPVPVYAHVMAAATS